MNDAFSGTAPETTGDVKALEASAWQVVALSAALTIRMAVSAATKSGRAFSIDSSDAITSLPGLMEVHAESSTEADAGVRQLATQLLPLFRRWEELRFDEGMENDVSRTLRRLLSAHSSTLIRALTEVVASQQVSPRVSAEALLHVGRFVHLPSKGDRLWLLAANLRAASPWSRDGAALGLAHLNDPDAIQYLEKAIETETVESLKEDLQQVLEELKATRDAAAAQDRQ